MVARAIMAFKILNNHVILEPNLLPKVNYKHPDRYCKGIRVGSQYQLHEPQARLDVARTSFFFAIPKIWNSNVTSKQASSTTVDSFKRNF